MPICMPPDGTDYTGKVATGKFEKNLLFEKFFIKIKIQWKNIAVSGWGRLKYGGGVPSVLQEVQVSRIAHVLDEIK